MSKSAINVNLELKTSVLSGIVPTLRLVLGPQEFRAAL